MGLFKPDLYRNFGIGFMIGALLVGLSLAPQFSTDIVSPASAATAPVATDSGAANSR